jgi:hypothetical protein
LAFFFVHPLVQTRIELASKITLNGSCEKLNPDNPFILGILIQTMKDCLFKKSKAELAQEILTFLKRIPMLQ